MHGGAPNSGAPLGDRNAFKHGHYVRAAVNLRLRMQDLARRAHRLAREMG